MLSNPGSMALLKEARPRSTSEGSSEKVNVSLVDAMIESGSWSTPGSPSRRWMRRGRETLRLMVRAAGPGRGALAAIDAPMNDLTGPFGGPAAHHRTL